MTDPFTFLGDMPFLTLSGESADSEDMRRRTIEAARFVFAFSYYGLSPERVTIQDQGGPVARGGLGAHGQEMVKIR
jgi:hypothetical protein